MKQRFAALAALTFCGALGTLSASVMGNMTISDRNCGLGSGVIVTTTAIDWLPLGGGSGCIQTGTGTTLTSGPGNVPLGVGTDGLIKDLPIGGTVLGFMTFTGFPNLFFDLNQLGPGPINILCANSFDTNLPACSVGGPNTPFRLSPNGTGTTVTLAATGVAHDGDGTTSTWTGSFSTDFAGLTPQNIQHFFLGIDDGGDADGKGCTIGTCASTYAGRFTVTINAVPEPGSMVLIGGGLLGLAITMRKRKK